MARWPAFQPRRTVNLIRNQVVGQFEFGAKLGTFSRNAASRIPRSKSLWGTGNGRLAPALGCFWAAFWNKCSVTLRSAHGHWRTQISTSYPTADFGPALQRLPDGSFQPRIETQARIRGIDSLLATRPWIDIVDMQIFLEGFETGAQWGRSNPNLDNGEDRRAGA
jgi:hypothetical protein